MHAGNVLTFAATSFTALPLPPLTGPTTRRSRCRIQSTGKHLHSLSADLLLSVLCVTFPQDSIALVVLRDLDCNGELAFGYIIIL